MSPAATTIVPDFLDMELLSRLPSLELRARYLVEGFMAGMHRSPFRGQNVEFKEFRSYQVGDEPRTIDWKVYARSDRLYVKLREEETNLTAYLVLDVSRSMSYRSPRAMMSKWDYARAVAAALLLLFSRQQDATALALAGNGLTEYIGPSLRSSERQRMMAALHRQADASGGSLAETISKIAQLAKRRSLVFVISDFYESPVLLEEPIGRLHYQACETLFFHVMDPLELDFQFDSAVMLEELETDLRLPISPEIHRKTYLKQLQAHREALARLVQRYGGDYLLLRTDRPPVDGLGIYLAKRKGML